MIHRRRAFTLVEVLLAMTLAAMMMAGVMTVIGTIGRDRARLAVGDPINQSATIAAIDMIRRDLVNGRRIWFMTDGAGFVITGYGALDRDTLEPTAELSRVTYAIEDGVLYRQQELIDGRRGEERWTDLVMMGVKSLALRPPPPAAVAPDLPDPDAEAREAFLLASSGREQRIEGVPMIFPVEIMIRQGDGSLVSEVIRR